MTAGRSYSVCFINIDIADCAKRQPEEIKAALKMFGKYSEYAPTYLGLNKSEAMVMHNVLCGGLPHCIVTLVVKVKAMVW